MPDYPRPSPAKEASHDRQKIYRIVLNSADMQAGGTLDNATYVVHTAPWLMDDNIDLGDKHWELRMESFTYQATPSGSATPLALEVHIQDWPTQCESYHTTLQGFSDVVGVVSGTTAAITGVRENSIGDISLASRPLCNRIGVRLSQLGQTAPGVPAFAGVSGGWYHMSLALIPCQ